MVYKLNGDLDDKIAALTNANSKLEDAYDILQSVKESIDDGSWTGKSQKISKALCEICDKYHKGILKSTEKEMEILKKLYDDADGYMSSGKIPSEWK